MTSPIEIMWIGASTILGIIGIGVLLFFFGWVVYDYLKDRKKEKEEKKRCGTN